MKHTKVMVRQVVQKRQYEPLDISIEAELEDGDKLEDVVVQLKKEVAEALVSEVKPTIGRAVTKVAEQGKMPTASPTPNEDNF